jgi:hypothetical protein
MQDAAGLLAGLRWDRAGDQRLRSLDAGEWDALWSLVRAGAGQHLLARRLRMAGLEAPPEVAERLRRHAMAVARRGLASRAIVLSALRATGRPMLLLKGVDLAERLYGNLGVRPMIDIDFLVHERDIGVFDAHFRADGYTPTPTPYEALIRSPRHHHAHYRHPGRQSLPLELHWRLANDARYGAIDVAGIWARAQPHGALPGAMVMAPDDLFLYLCLHLKQHGFDTPLTQIWDLAEMLNAPALALDWPTIWRRAADWHLTRTVQIALFLVRDALGVPTAGVSDWTPDAELARHLPDVLAQLGRHPVADQVTGPRVPVLLSSRSSWRQRLRALRDGALPSREEIRALHGRPGDGLWRDCLSYLRGWRHLVRRRGRAVSTALAGTPAVRAHIERVSALRRHLDAG